LAPGQEAELRLRVVGDQLVEAGGPPPRGRATRLLGLLAAFADDEVLTDDLVEALWAGEAPPRYPSRIVASLVSRLRAALGRDRIVGGPRSYRLVTGPDTAVDLTAARLLLSSAESAAEHLGWQDAYGSATRVIELLSGGEALAHEPPTGLVQEARRQAAGMLRRARELVWTSALHLGKRSSALDAVAAALARDPLNEAAVRAGMVAHAQLGRSAEALRSYERLRTALADQLGADPSNATNALHLSLLRGELVSATELEESGNAVLAESGLDAAVLRLLGNAAVLGETFDPHQLGQLAAIPMGELLRLLQSAHAAGLLVPSGTRFSFVDSNLLLACYHALPEPIRAMQHRRAAQMPGNAPVEQARHWSASGEDAAAARAWAAAAAQVVDQPDVAEALLSEAIAAAQRAGDVRLAALLLVRRCSARVDLDRFDDACADGNAALQYARRLGDSELEAQALEALGWAALNARDADATVEFAHRARELAESAAAAPEHMAGAMLLVGRLRHWDGDLDGAQAAYDEALASGPGPRQRAIERAFRGAVLEHRDQFASARRTLDGAARSCARTGQFRPLVQSLFFAAMARGNAGDLSGGLRLVDQGRDLLDERGVDYYRPGLDVVGSWLWRELGELGRAEELAYGALEACRAKGRVRELEQELHALLVLAECRLAAGGPEAEAAALLAEAQQRLSGECTFTARAELRVLDVASRIHPEAAEALLVTAVKGGSPKYEALALHRLGRTGEAVAVAERIGADLLLSHLGGGPAARAAAERIGHRLSRDLRGGWLRHGEGAESVRTAS
jgi:DNA-binding SARP family transcriptional activator